MTRARYRKKSGQTVTAVRLALDTKGFIYRKWGGEQHCDGGDWIVDDDGEVHTVDADSFTATYAMVSPGRYEKCAPVWAERASAAGSVETKEGVTRYEAGDFVVSNDAEGDDSWAVAKDRFEATYEPLDER